MIVKRLGLLALKIVLNLVKLALGSVFTTGNLTVSPWVINYYLNPSFYSVFERSWSSDVGNFS